MNTYLNSGVEVDRDKPSSRSEIKIPEKFISDPNTRYWFIDNHFNRPISHIYTSGVQNLFERIVDLLFTEAEEELLEEIFDAVPDLISKQTLRLKVYKYQIENNFFDTTEARWFAEGQVQILEKAIYKSTVLMNMDPTNPEIPSNSSLETNIETSLVESFIDDIPTRPATNIDKLELGAGFLNTNPNALSNGKEFRLPFPDKRNSEWYGEVFTDLKKYLDSLDPKLLDVSVIGILVKIMQYIASGIDDFHVVMSEKKVLDAMLPSIGRAIMFDLESYFTNGDSQKGEELVEYVIRNLNELKKLFPQTIGGETRVHQLNGYISRFQREYLEFFQTRARNIQVQMWEGYREKEILKSTIENEDFLIQASRSSILADDKTFIELIEESINNTKRSLLEKLNSIKIGYGYSEVGITLVERHLRRLITAYKKGLLDEFCMRRNLEAILNVSGFNHSVEIEGKTEFNQRILRIIQDSPELLGFYSQLIEAGRAEERREL